ncbi:hypothetical protein ADUPG1_000113, partial [Aduncisulcus paluster]
ESACVCATGFYLDTAISTCAAADDGVCDTCGGERGECVYSIDLSTTVCECFDGWFGDECSSQCPTDSNGNVCSSNGTCNYAFSMCSCSNDTFFGSACQLECVAEVDCSGNGTCKFTTENGLELVTCQCNDGFGGDSCENVISSSMETWVLVLIICGSVAVVCVVVVIIVKCSCSSKSSKKKSAHKRKNVSGQNSRDLPEMQMVSNPMFRKSKIHVHSEMQMVRNPMLRKSTIPPHLPVFISPIPQPHPVIETRQLIHSQPIDVFIHPMGSGDMIVSDPSMPPIPMPPGLVGSTPIPGHHDTTHVQEYDHMEPIMSGEIDELV